MANAAGVWPRQPFIGITIVAAAGVAVADWLPNAGAPAIALVLLLALVASATRHSVATYFFIAAAFFLLHSNRVTQSPAKRLEQRLGPEPKAVIARGMVVSEPKVSASETATFVFAVQSLDIDGTPEPVQVRMLSRWKHAVEFGDELTLFGTAEVIPPPRNPGEFDMRGYLARQDITRQLIVRYAENGALVRHSLGNIVLRAAQKSRAWLHRVLTRGLEDSPDVQNLISGMALGLRHQTGEDIEEPFQQTGTLHLFAVAGLHVGIVAHLLWILAAITRVPRRWATALIIPLLFFYAAITGLHTSSVRAAWMSALLLSGYFAERKVYSLNSLAAAAFIILAWNTNELFSVGFQLSFAVVGTILVVATPTMRFLRGRLQFDPFLPRSLFGPARRVAEKAFAWLASGTAVSFAAWLGSLPLMLWYYNLVTTISLVANLVVVPIAFLVLAGALLSAITAPFSSWVSLVFNNANWLLSRAIIKAVQLFAMLPYGHWYVERPHWPTHATAELTALDLGTGGAIHLRAASREWLIDTGAQRDFDRTLQPYLRFRGVDTINALVLTHGDAGHIGGAQSVLQVFSPRQVIEPGGEDRSRVHRALIEQIRSDQRYGHCAAGDHWHIAANVEARVLFPPGDFSADAADDQALVVQLQMGPATRVLLMSDSGEATERALLAQQLDLRSDIIIKGQHRSGVSGIPEFIDAVRPTAVFATSRDFPENERIKEEWVAELASRGIRLFRQDQTGAVNVRGFRDHYEIRSYLSPEIFRSNTR